MDLTQAMMENINGQLCEDFSFELLIDEQSIITEVGALVEK